MNMVKPVSTFMLILLFCISTVNAKNNGKIFFNEDEIERLSDQEKKYIKKSVYEVVYYTKVFELIIGRFRKGLSLESSFSIDIKITPSAKDKKAEDIELRLRNLKNNKVINFVESKKVSRIKVQYTVRRLLFKLFYEENYDEEKDIIINNEVIPISASTSAESASSDEASSDNNNEDSNNDDVSDENLASAITKDVEEENKLENKGQNRKNKKSPKKKDKEVKISEFESPDVDLRVEKEAKVFTPTSFKINTEIFINLGQSNSATDSTSIIETKTETQEIKIEFGSRFSIGDSRDYYEAGLSVGKIAGENSYGLSPSFQLNLDYGLSLYRQFLYITPGIEYETFSFADLSSRGEGIVPWNNNLLWFGAKGRLHLFDNRFELYIGYSKGMIGQSDLGKKGEAFPIEGSKVSLGTIIKIYGKFGLGLSVDRSEYLSSASRSFQAKNSSMKMLLTYR